MQLSPIDLAARRVQSRFADERVLACCKTKAPRFWEMAEVVGKWVWIQFDEKQPPQITAELSELGFHWNNRRQVWQHPCGQIMDRARNLLTRAAGMVRSFLPTSTKMKWWKRW
jgi:precorrin-6B methylase 1